MTSTGKAEMTDTWIGDPPTDRGPVVGVPQQDLDDLRARADRHSAERLEALNCNARQAQQIAQLESREARLRARNEKLEGALRPFADFDCYVDEDPNEEWFRHDGAVLMVGDFQRARAALEDGE